jgi:hypothetical protein
LRTFGASGYAAIPVPVDMLSPRTELLTGGVAALPVIW